MAKGVIGEETRLKLAEGLLSQSAVPSEVGLLIGKFSSSLGRAFLFDLIPTPHNDSAEPACALTDPDKKKATKSNPADSSSLFIDKDWVAEHARQVSRMLVGGIKVVGLYVWVSDAAFKNSTIMLCQTVKGVAEAAPVLEGDWDERLLLHISYSPRRWNCRNCSLSSNITSSSLRPCDFKMGKVLTSLQTFKCMHNFNLRLPILRDSASKFQTLSDVLRHTISIHAKELAGAKALIDGKLVVESESYSSDGVHEVELLLSFLNDSSIEACSQGDVVGILSFSGLICSFAYLNSKEPNSQAITDIKGDIITSLQSRLDIICDEVDVDSGNNHDVGSQVSNEISAEKPVPQLVLHLLRLSRYIYILPEFLRTGILSLSLCNEAVGFITYLWVVSNNCS
uniref:Protein odr-4 homolog n=1 Tax=Glycine max TaxID=3847 RepID=A0A0R0KEF7_SOYBN